MQTVLMVPRLSERDEALGTEGAIDPLGLAAIADRLGTKLVPGVRERQLHPRFLTVMAVSLAIANEFEADKVASDGISEPWQVFEWYFVEGLVRTSRSSDSSESGSTRASRPPSEELPATRGVPGSLKARQALDEGVPLSAQRYLKTPMIFGFHGVYRLLSRTLGIELKDSGRLGDVGYELLDVWAKERGLTGFRGAMDGSGGVMRRRLVEAVQEGLDRGATARPKDWSGWKFFREHLDITGAGPAEAGFLMQKLRGDSEGYRRELIEFLVSKSGRKVWNDSHSEREFHAAIRKQASSELARLLDAIDSYEAFARKCQDAFDDCLVEMTRSVGRTLPGQLGVLPAVQRASREVPDIFSELLERLEPFGESVRFSQSCASLGTRCSATEWAHSLIQHHSDTQRRKPPEGKQPWIIRLDGDCWQIRTRYRRNELVKHDDQYLHGYRTNSLWSFAHDLKVLR